MINEKFKLMIKSKAMSVQSIIIGSVISGVIVAGGLAVLWSSVDKSKLNTMASTLKEYNAYIVSQAHNGFANIDVIHNKPEYADSDADYLDELIKAGEISNIPYELFSDSSVLTFEMRKIVSPVNNDKLFYLHLSSTNIADSNLIDSIVEHINMTDEFVYTKP